MRKQFGNKTAVPVELGQRVIARLMMAGLVLVAYVVQLVGTAWAISNYAFEALTVLNGIVVVYALGLAVWNFVTMATQSTSVGGKFRGFRFVKDDTGEDGKALVLAKYLVESVFEGVTLGLGMISYLVSYREGQHWLDRAFKLTAVTNDSVELAFQGSSGVQAAPGPQQPRVMPVTMPAGSPRSPEAPGFGPRRPAQADQPQQAAPQTQPAPVVSIATPLTQPREQPTRDAVPPANPWALPGQQPAAPVDPTPVHQPVLQPAAPAEPARSFVPRPEPVTSAPPIPPIAVASPLDDETVIDADIAAEHAPAVVLDDGEVLRVDGPVVLGRNPSAPAAYPQARSVAVTDESMRMSKTHVVLVPGDGGIGVFDVGATNGVHLEVDGNRTRIPVGEVQDLPVEAVLHFGGRTLKVAP